MLQFFAKKKKGCKGFTLIELLVVIAIIGILASIVLVSLNKARSKARDVRRMGDLRNVAVAAEMYYDEAKSYPTALTSAAFTFPATGGTTYLGTAPADPGSTLYVWVSDPQKYVICATLENPTKDASDNNLDIFYVRESGSGTATDCPDL